MLNYVALNLLGWLLVSQRVPGARRTARRSRGTSTTRRRAARTCSAATLRVHFGHRRSRSPRPAGAAWLLDRSTLGFELRAVGANPDAARTAGMKRRAARTPCVMLIAGALAGLAGVSQILGTEPRR